MLLKRKNTQTTEQLIPTENEVLKKNFSNKYVLHYAELTTGRQKLQTSTDKKVLFYAFLFNWQKKDTAFLFSLLGETPRYLEFCSILYLRFARDPFLQNLITATATVLYQSTKSTAARVTARPAPHLSAPTEPEGRSHTLKHQLLILCPRG